MPYLNKKRSRTKGFTLIELVLAVSISMVLGLAVYRALSNGIELWNFQTSQKVENDISIFFEKFKEDVNNMTLYSLADFKGEFDNAYWYVNNTSLPLFDSETAINIAPLYKVHYEFDADSGSIVKHEYKMGEFEPSSSKVVLKGVNKVEFSYQVFNPGVDEMVEKDYMKDSYPLAIGVKIGYKTFDGKSAEIKKDIYIPIVGEVSHA